MMDLNEYQSKALVTAVYPSEFAEIYPALKLAGEAGEVAEKVGKMLRGDYVDMEPEEFNRMIARELGDVLWYIAAFARDLGWTLEEVADENLAKLADRGDRGVLRGSGDDR